MAGEHFAMIAKITKQNKGREGIMTSDKRDDSEQKRQTTRKQNIETKPGSFAPTVRQVLRACSKE